jgi:CHAT domain-containing protein/Tfp pilus assembly protein PilF
MNQRLYPKEQYAQGHPELASSLNNLGLLLQAQGEYAKALPFLLDALAMNKKLYPKEQYPQGHPQLAHSLNNLGFVLQAQGEYAQAEPFFRDALAMRQTLYPKAQYPQGHPDLAQSLNNLGMLLEAQGEHGRALPILQDALAMRQTLYPKDKYPQGHPLLTQSLNNLASLLQAQGEHGRALPILQDALAMFQQQANRMAASASEAQALNFVATLPLTRDGLLSTSRHLAAADAGIYRALWPSRAALTRVYERRHLALLAAAASKEVAALWAQLLQARRQREHLLLAPVPADLKSRDQRLKELNEQIEQLDRQLLPLLPAVARADQLARSSPADLQQNLSPGTVFIDLLRYIYFEQDPKKPGKKGERRTPHYVGFVLTRDQIHRVELGEAKAIEQTLSDWREALTAWQPGRSEVNPRYAEAVRRLVWDKLAKQVPAGTHTVYLAPDGVLTQLPWAALPGSRKNSVLLEDYLLAVVPHGPFLLERLTAPVKTADGAPMLLAVGAVQYDQAPASLSPSERVLDGQSLRSALPGVEKLSWPFLQGSERELQQVSRVVELGKWAVRPLTGVRASTSRLLLELPKARYAHLATHGFFADKQFRSVLQLDEKLFERTLTLEGNILERIGAGARNPLVLSGLVLAGANRAETPGRGILSADAIVGLPLDQLQLAVLSACETGLGDVAGGEGVHGLQRAFHLAGAHNVIASLWQVNDEATAALMVLFYRALLEGKEKRTPLEALREAQLLLYYNPQHIATWAKGERALNVAKPKPATQPPPKETTEPAPPALQRTPVRYWAAFVLSGLGR